MYILFTFPRNGKFLLKMLFKFAFNFFRDSFSNDFFMMINNVHSYKLASTDNCLKRTSV